MNDAASLPRLAQFTHTADSVNLLFARSLSEDYTDTSSEWVTFVTRAILTAPSIETPTTTTTETSTTDITTTDITTPHCLFAATLTALKAPSFPLVSPAQLLFLFYCLRVCDDDTCSLTPLL